MVSHRDRSREPRIGRTKTAIIAALTVLLLGGGGVAFAFWTSMGSGSGIAKAVTTVANITVNQPNAITGLQPGAAPQTLSGDFTNTNPGAVTVTKVTASIDSVTLSDGSVGSTAAGSCSAQDYALSSGASSVTANSVPSGTHVGSWSGQTISFVDDAGRNQDGCKGATVNLAYSAVN